MFRRTTAIFACLLLSSFALLLATTQRAEGYVYWTNQSGHSIGRANTDGTGVSQDFISGLGRVQDIAVDDDHIFWTTAGSGWIGRARLDGTDVDPDFIAGDEDPHGLVIYNDHIFWANASGVGKAATDGTSVTVDWIGSSSWRPCSLAQHNGYFYWTWRDLWWPYAEYTKMARYNPATADGGVPDHLDILQRDLVGYDINPVYGLCATGSYLYWRSNGAIGRATTPYGLSPNRDYITGLAGDLPGSNLDWSVGCRGLAVLHDQIYFTTSGFSDGPANIGRVGTNGTGLDNSFITGCLTPSGVAADDLTAATSLAGVADEIAAARLPSSVVKPLLQKLRNARATIDRGNAKAARNLVNATIRQLAAQAGKTLPRATAERWVEVLTLLRTHIA